MRADKGHMMKRQSVLLAGGRDVGCSRLTRIFVIRSVADDGLEACLGDRCDVVDSDLAARGVVVSDPMH